MALKVNDNDVLPHYFCYECATMLQKYHKFKEKCYCGQKAFQENLWRGPITYESTYKIDQKAHNLQSSLEIMTVTDLILSYIVTEPELKPEDQRDIENSPVSPKSDPPSPTSIFMDIKREVIRLEKKHIDLDV